MPTVLIELPGGAGVNRRDDGEIDHPGSSRPATIERTSSSPPDRPVIVAAMQWLVTTVADVLARSASRPTMIGAPGSLPAYDEVLPTYGSRDSRGGHGHDGPLQT